MLEMIIFGVGMFAITLLIQYLIHRSGKKIDFWVGTSVVFVICVLGLITKDVAYFAGILGYVIGDDVGKFAGWH